MAKKQDKTDRILFSIRNNKFVAYIIVVSLVIIAIIAFAEKIQSGYSMIFGGTKVSNVESLSDPPAEPSRENQLLAMYNADSLRKQNFVHVLVARRDFGMHFLCPADWDYIEPLDEPAGLRYKSYFLPRDASCTIVAWAAITCLRQSDELDKDLAQDSSNSCSLEQCVQKRIAYLQSNLDSFILLSQNPTIKMLYDSLGHSGQIECQRIKYSYVKSSIRYYCMVCIIYWDDVQYTLKLEASESEYPHEESMFIEMTKSIYLEHLNRWNS